MITVGPFGKPLPYKEALERELNMKVWVAEHSKGNLQQEALKECEEIVQELEKAPISKPKGKPRKKKSTK